jgi:hypothetical protein
MMTLKKIKEKISSIYNLTLFDNSKYSKIFFSILALIILFSILSYVGVFKFIHERPNSIHHSSFCQRASIAQNYYETDMNFFKPKINRFIEGEGITGCEFPIIYYVVAILYKIFGFNEIFFKLIGIMLYITGSIAFLSLIKMYIKNFIVAVLIFMSVFMSPMIFYYMSAFNPDMPSLFLTLIAWYSFFKYLNGGKFYHFNFFLVWTTLACLLKVIAIMQIGIVILIILLNYIGFFKDKYPQLKANFWKLITKVIVCILIILSWYIYARWLVKHYNVNSFALGVVMAKNANEVKEIFEYVKNLWLYQYYGYETYVLLIAAFFGSLLLIKFSNRILLVITISYILGSIAYVTLFSVQFKHHDYYILPVLPTAFFLVLMLADILNAISKNKNQIIMIIFGIILIFNIKETIAKCKSHYEKRLFYEADYNASMFLRPYFDLETKLRKLNIKRSDKVISAFDNSFCSTLYLMNQTGEIIYPECKREDIERLLSHPDVKYLIVNDLEKLTSIYPVDLKNRLIGCHRGLLIYKLK